MSHDQAIGDYVDVVVRIGDVFGGPIVGVEKKGDKQGKPSAFVVAGMELTVVEIVRALPGGPLIQDADAKEAVERLDARTEEQRMRRLSKSGLDSAFRDDLRVLMLYVSFSDENLARLVVPPGSEVAANFSKAGFVDDTGRVRLPIPPLVGTKVTNAAVNRLDQALEDSSLFRTSPVPRHAAGSLATPLGWEPPTPRRSPAAGCLAMALVAAGIGDGSATGGTRHHGPQVPDRDWGGSRWSASEPDVLLA